MTATEGIMPDIWPSFLERRRRQGLRLSIGTTEIEPPAVARQWWEQQLLGKWRCYFPATDRDQCRLKLYRGVSGRDFAPRHVFSTLRAFASLLFTAAINRRMCYCP